MHWPSDISIRQKLQGIVMVTCAAALLVATIVFTFYDRVTSLRAKTQDLIVSAQMIGSISTAALTFHDPRSAQEILSSAPAGQPARCACIYRASRKVSDF